MANSTEKNILLFLSEEDARTMIDALLNAYGAADVYARGMALQFKQKCDELEETKKKLDDASRQLIITDTALNDAEDERAEWKDKYMKLKEQLEKMTEREGK